MSDRRMGPLIVTLLALVAAGGAYCLFALGLMTIEMNGSSGQKEMRMLALLLTTVAGIFVLRGPVGRAIARLLDGGGTDTGTADLEQRIHELEERLANASEQDRLRIEDLSERLDFAERLLARGGNEPAKLGEPLR